MSTIHLHQTTAATPQHFVARLTDFGPGRSQLFGNSALGVVVGIGMRRFLGKALGNSIKAIELGTAKQKLT